MQTNQITNVIDNGVKEICCGCGLIITQLLLYTWSSNAPIIASVDSISHYWPLFLASVSVISERCNRYCNKCTNNVISCDYNIINYFYDTHNY